MTSSDDNPVDPMPQGGCGRAIRLIVNADDFGLCERVNDGIVLAHRSGIVTAASLMPVGRAFNHAVAWCRRVPSLDVGVHLTLVAETAVLSEASSLSDDDGRLPRGIGAFVRGYLGGSIRRADIQAELCAQIERVLDQGLRVTHLDSHQHVHALPGIAGLVLRLAARYGIPFVRVPVEPWRNGRPANLHGIFRLAGATALRTCWTMARLAGPVRARFQELNFLGFTEGGHLDGATLRRLLRALQPRRTYELMCHPGFQPDEPDVKRWNYCHEQELLALTSARTRSAIAERGIRLCRFQDLAAW
jgi:chitin disaccharide deacetylase